VSGHKIPEPNASESILFCVYCDGKIDPETKHCDCDSPTPFRLGRMLRKVLDKLGNIERRLDEFGKEVHKMAGTLADVQQAIADLNTSVQTEVDAITAESAEIDAAITALQGQNPDLSAVVASLQGVKANIDTATGNVTAATAKLTAAVPAAPNPAAEADAAAAAKAAGATQSKYN